MGNRGSHGTAAAPDNLSGESALHPDVQRVRDGLIGKYSETVEDLGHGMSEEAVEERVDAVFVNLVMLQRSELRDEFKQIAGHGSLGDMERTGGVGHVFSQAARNMESVELGSVFDVKLGHDASRKRSLHILALASGGCGKTMVFWSHAPQQWAKGLLWPEFILLFALRFSSKEVQLATDEVELFGLTELGVTSETKKGAVVDFIQLNPEKVCMIFDGMDEVSLEACSEYVKKVVRGKALQGLRIIVTSRPSEEVFSLSTSHPFQRQLELIGFRSAQIQEYVKKVVPKETAKRVLEGMAKDKQLQSMMATPFFAAATCQLHDAGYPLPKCMTDVFVRTRMTYTML